MPRVSCSQAFTGGWTEDVSTVENLFLGGSVNGLWVSLRSNKVGVFAVWYPLALFDAALRRVCAGSGDCVCLTRTALLVSQNVTLVPDSNNICLWFSCAIQLMLGTNSDPCDDARSCPPAAACLSSRPFTKASCLLARWRCLTCVLLEEGQSESLNENENQFPGAQVASLGFFRR